MQTAQHRYGELAGHGARLAASACSRSTWRSRRPRCVACSLVAAVPHSSVSIASFFCFSWNFSAFTIFAFFPRTADCITVAAATCSSSDSPCSTFLANLPRTADCTTVAAASCSSFSCSPTDCSDSKSAREPGRR